MTADIDWMSFQDGYIDSAEDLERLSGELRGEEIIAVDMESNGFFRYPESICLIQIGYGGEQYLVDTVALKNIDPLLAILADPEKLCILHSCSYDVSSFKRDYDMEFGRLFDTSIAAAYLGLKRLGLDAVLKETLGVDIPKDKSLQRCDWTERPLTPKQILYAKTDVKHLHALHAAQSARLAELGRTNWVEEECEIAKSIPYVHPPPPETAFLKGKQVGKLSPRAKSIYKEVFVYREQAALAKGVPPFRVFHNDLILRIANRCTETGRPLDRSINLPYQHVDGIKNAVAKGLAAPPFKDERRRPSKQRLDDKQTKRLKRLKDIRSTLGKRLNLDPPLLWRTPNLEELAVCETREEAEQTFHGDNPPRKWQIKEFGEDMLSIFT